MFRNVILPPQWLMHSAPYVNNSRHWYSMIGVQLRISNMQCFNANNKNSYMTIQSGWHNMLFMVECIFVLQFVYNKPWWRHEMETFSALLAICAGNSTVAGEFPAQRPVTRSFNVYFYLRLNKRLSKQWWGWWFEMPSQPLWRHCSAQSADCQKHWPVCRLRCNLYIRFPCISKW